MAKKKFNPFEQDDDIPEKEDRSMQIAEAAEFILPYFSPASTIDKATSLLTTQEVWDAIRQINPATSILPTDVYEALVENDFTYLPDPNRFTFQYKWLMIKKV